MKLPIHTTRETVLKIFFWSFVDRFLQGQWSLHSSSHNPNCPTQFDKPAWCCGPSSTGWGGRHWKRLWQYRTCSKGKNMFPPL